MNWTLPPAANSYTLTANSLFARGGPITFNATVAAALPVIFASSLVNGFGPSDLYTVQIGANGVDTPIGQIRTAAGLALNITDIASLPDASLVGITFSQLYSIDRQTAIATLPVAIAGACNGLAEDASGYLLRSTLTESSCDAPLEGICLGSWRRNN